MWNVCNKLLTQHQTRRRGILMATTACALLVVLSPGASAKSVVANRMVFGQPRDPIVLERGVSLAPNWGVFTFTRKQAKASGLTPGDRIWGLQMKLSSESGSRPNFDLNYPNVTVGVNGLMVRVGPLLVQALSYTPGDWGPPICFNSPYKYTGRDKLLSIVLIHDQGETEDKVPAYLEADRSLHPGSGYAALGSTANLLQWLVQKPPQRTDTGIIPRIKFVTDQCSSK